MHIFYTKNSFEKEFFGNSWLLFITLVWTNIAQYKCNECISFSEIYQKQEKSKETKFYLTIESWIIIIWIVSSPTWFWCSHEWWIHRTFWNSHKSSPIRVHTKNIHRWKFHSKLIGLESSIVIIERCIVFLFWLTILIKFLLLSIIFECNQRVELIYNSILLSNFCLYWGIILPIWLIPSYIKKSTRYIRITFSNYII